MSSYLYIRVWSDAPQLLAGLDSWAKLGLLSDGEIRDLACRELACSRTVELPAAPPEPVTAAVTSQATEPLALPGSTHSSDAGRSPFPAWPQLWGSLRENFSILWLLAAGIFTIVMASTGLALTQWQNLPAVLQYGLLWAYTLGFAGASFWSARRGGLVLTARALRILAGLLVPVNFWAIDTFDLWRSGPIGWGAIALATLTLGGWLLSVSQLPQAGAYLATSVLHLFHGQPPFFEIGLYGGIAALALVQEVLRRPQPLWSFYALGLLFLRGWGTGLLPVEGFALGFGFWGWLLSRDRARVGPLRAAGEALAGVLLALGALVSWDATPPPWQVTAIVGMGLELCGRRLRRTGLASDVFLTFGTGLVAYVLIWRWVPSVLQDSIRQVLWRWLEADWPFSRALVGLLALFPYLLVFVALLPRLSLTERVRRRGEVLALVFGAAIALSCLWSPGTRAVSWTALAGLWGWLGWRWHSRATVAIAHGTGLLAVAAWLAWQVSPNPQSGWLVACTLGTGLEWMLGYQGDRRRHWRGRLLRQGWSFGFGLAAIAYLLAMSRDLAGTPWGLLWGVLPLGLAGLAQWARPARRRQLAPIAAVALSAAVVPVWNLPAYRLTSWGIATIAMLPLVGGLPRLWMAALHLGYGLAYAIACLQPLLAGTDWALAAAVAVWLLWLGTARGRRIYARAGAGWAIALTLLLGLFLLGRIVLAYSLPGSPIPWQLPLAASIVTGAALLWTFWPRTTRTAWPLASLLELAVAAGVAFFGGRASALGAANLVLAWLAIGLPLPRRGERRSLSVAFALLAFVLHFFEFGAFSGFMTAGVAGAFLVLGSRSQVKPLTYCGLAGLSLAAGELVFFHLPATQLSVLLAIATLGTAISLAYSGLAIVWPQANRANLSRAELQLAATIHWFAGNFALGLTAWVALVDRGAALSAWVLGLPAILALLAAARGRRASLAAAIWIDCAWWELTGTVLFARLLMPAALRDWDPWWGLLASGAAAAIAVLPWQRWGWPHRRPWQRVASTLPLVAALSSFAAISAASLLAIAAHYARMAWQRRSWRWSYASVAFLLWGSWDALAQLGGLHALVEATLASSALLYVAQVDPALRRAEFRAGRHLWRCVGSLPICVVAVVTYGDPGIVPAAIGLGLSLAGLALRVRAFLLLGSLTLGWTVLDVSLAFSQQYAFARWLIGLALGSLLVGAAAIFEGRRGRQLLAAIDLWWQDLVNWE